MRAEVYIDPLAEVASSVRLGRGTKVWAFTRILEGAVIGVKCQLGQNVYVDRNTRIGNCVKVQNNVSIYTGVHVEDGVFLGPSCVFTNVEFPRALIERKAEFAATRISRGVTVGANATIVCGVTLGEFSLIGAGAVVTGDVSPFSLVVGNPAKPIGWVCACGERPTISASGEGRCKRCGILYEVCASSCRPLDPERFEKWWQTHMNGKLADSTNDEKLT